MNLNDAYEVVVLMREMDRLQRMRDRLGNCDEISGSIKMNDKCTEPFVPIVWRRYSEDIDRLYIQFIIDGIDRRLTEIRNVIRDKY